MRTNTKIVKTFMFDIVSILLYYYKHNIFYWQFALLGCNPRGQNVSTNTFAIVFKM